MWGLMMRVKILSLIFVLILCFNVQAFQQQGAGADVGITCPSYYASAILSMNFEEGLNACDSSGNAVLFTNPGSADIGAYGHTGQGMKIDAENEIITLTQSAKQYFDETADQTLCLKIKISEELTNEAYIFEVVDVEDNDQIMVKIADPNPPDMTGYYNTESDANAATGTAIDINTWEVIGYSWEGTGAGVAGDNSANAGGSATWDDGWENDADELNESVGESPINITIGGVSWTRDTETITIDEWALMSGYEADCSTLFSPE